MEVVGDFSFNRKINLKYRYKSVHILIQFHNSVKKFRSEVIKFLAAKSVKLTSKPEEL